ncbi:MAG: hemerythrin family protein [Sideroxydans sp.]|nr:hemerythrin family protein [Sideroxydans sp.]
MQNQPTPPQNDPTLFDHNQFIHLREQLLDLLDQHAADNAIDAQLDEILQHMRSQFEREEQAMQAAHFPPTAAHKADHDRAYADFAERIARWKQQREREPLLDFIEAGLADWFVKHVNTRDYITARFLSEGHA